MPMYSLSLILSLLMLTPSLADEARPGDVGKDINSEDIMTHVRYLSSDELEGRMTGEKGCAMAAGYIAGHFEEAGLKPLGDGGTYFQNFSLPERMVPGKFNSLAVITKGVREQLEMGRDFFPLDISANGFSSGGMVFVGYGISAPELGHDDYEGLDVRGKIVLALRSAPLDMDYRSRFYDYASLRYKAINAGEKGASGIILITPASQDEEENLESAAFESSPGNAGIEAVIIRREKAEEILRSSGKHLDDLERLLSQRKNASFAIPDSRAQIRTELITAAGESANVLGILEGSDPVLKKEVIVIGAHYDHLGNGETYGGYGKEKGKIYNGADDNASGVAGLLELSRYFAGNRATTKRSLLFIAFSGEEVGLLGSSYYIEHPEIPAGNTIAMINMDMIGRLSGNKLMVLGVGSGEGWERLINEANSGIGLNISFMASAFGPSDQTAFYTDSVPAVQFFTGLHKDYHTPEDDWQKINPEGEDMVLDLIANLVTELANSREKITFSGEQRTNQGPPGINVYLGTVPDYMSREKGVRLSAVREGSPADRAGLAAGDTIMEFGGKTIENIYDYFHALEGSGPGVPVDLIIIRNGKQMTIKAVPEQR